MREKRAIIGGRAGKKGVAVMHGTEREGGIIPVSSQEEAVKHDSGHYLPESSRRPLVDGAAEILLLMSLLIDLYIITCVHKPAITC